MKKSIHDNAITVWTYTYGQRPLSAEPDRSSPRQSSTPSGGGAALHKTCLKEQHPIRYNQLLLSGELGGYLAKLDKQVEEQLTLTVRRDAG